MFLWRYLDATARDIGESDPFEDQETAEAWLSAEWEPLSDGGVAEVELFDDATATIVYRMALEPDPPG